MLDEYEPFRWRDFFKGIRTKWVIFAAGLAFFVIGLGSIDGWPAGHTAIVLMDVRAQYLPAMREQALDNIRAIELSRIMHRKDGRCSRHGSTST